MSAVNIYARRTVQQAYLTLSFKLPIDDKKVKDRLDRAVGIVNDYGYEMHKVSSDGEWQIWKSSTSPFDDNSVHYDVSRKGCNCPDYETARAGLCKHRLAVMLVEEMEREDL